MLGTLTSIVKGHSSQIRGAQKFRNDPVVSETYGFLGPSLVLVGENPFALLPCPGWWAKQSRLSLPRKFRVRSLRTGNPETLSFEFQKRVGTCWNMWKFVRLHLVLASPQEAQFSMTDVPVNS